MKLRYSIAASLMAIGAATVIAAPAQAQQITTGIQGQVKDDSGAAIGGATVVITDTRTGSARTIATGTDGRFSTTGLTTGGPYTIAVNADSFEGQTIQDVYTSLQGNTGLSFALASGGGEIVVTGRRGRVPPLRGGPGTSFQPGAVSASTVGTVVQNTLNNQKIQNLTVINATVNSMEILKSLNLQSMLKNAAIDSVRK